MRTRTAAAAVALVGFVSAAGCGDGAAAPPEEATVETFTATLSAANMVGVEIDSPGTGTATFTWDGTRLSFVLNVSGMTGVIAAHVHGPAQVDQNAAILLNLFIPSSPTGAVNGELARGAAVQGSPLIQAGTLASLLELMRAGTAYTLVHTQVNPNGEIRGQIAKRP